jgi:DNA gyrase subunit A
VLTAIPYQVGKNGLVEKIAEAAKDKRIEGVSDIRDESNREGVRVVIDLKRDATPDVVLNQLWRHTPAQASFPATCSPSAAAARDAHPARHHRSVRQFREEVITRRTKFELAKARDRAHILLGLVIAVTNLDEVVRIIRGSASPPPKRAPRSSPATGPSPRSRPISRSSKRSSMRSTGDTYRLSEAQVRAILELRLHRLTALGRDEIGGELRELATSIASCSRSSGPAPGYIM